MTHDERHEKWQKLIEEQKASGTSARRWCQEHAVPMLSFYSWRRRLAGSTSSGFVEVHSNAALTSCSGVSIEISGLRISVGRDFDEATLLRTLRLLTSRS